MERGYCGTEISFAIASFRNNAGIPPARSKKIQLIRKIIQFRRQSANISYGMANTLNFRKLLPMLELT